MNDIDEYENESLTRLVKENNRMLKAMNRREKTRSFFTFLKYTIIVGLFVFSYLQLKPYLDSLMNMYQQIGEQSESISGVTDQIGEFDLDKLKDIFGQ